MRLVFLVRELLVNHVQVCTSRDFMQTTLLYDITDEYKMCHMVVSALLQKVMKNTHSQHKDSASL